MLFLYFSLLALGITWNTIQVNRRKHGGWSGM